MFSRNSAFSLILLDEKIKKEGADWRLVCLSVKKNIWSSEHSLTPVTANPLHSSYSGTDQKAEPKKEKMSNQCVTA